MESSNQYKLELTYKICVFGDSGVGKSTLVDRYLTDTFHDNIRSTLGATINIKIVKIKHGKITLQIWDFGGEEKFRFIFPSYAAGSSAGIYLFDLTNPESLTNISNWLTIYRRASRNAVTLLVGSKLDLEVERVYRRGESLNLMKLYNFDNYIECSSKTGENISLLFRTVISEILKRTGHHQVEFIA
ncbi:MAG: Rab family GTPase [Promethearchaeota archaeon]